MAKIKRIAMFSVHGYFDPEPVLGRTDTGGQVTYVLELSKHLAQLGLEVDIYTRSFGGRSHIAPVADGVRIVRIAAGNDEFIRKEDLFPLLDEFVDNAQAFIEREQLEYQLLHAHYWDAGYVAMKLSQRLQVPFFFTAHSLGAWKQEQMGGDAAEMEKLFNFTQRIEWENKIFRDATAQTVTTLDGQDTYKRLYDFESPDMIIIPPGVDVKRFRPLEVGEADVALDVPDKFIFALSRIDSNKGLDYLIRGFAEIRDKTDAHLVIGGGSKEPKAHETEVKHMLTDLVDELGIGDRVTFTGYVPDELVETYYRNAQLFVLPSRYEPFGMTVLEAMGCGTAVVATALGGIRHVLHDGVDSVLVDPSNSSELGTAMLKVLDEAAVRRGLEQRGLELIRDKFSWDSIARQTLSFFESYV